MVKRALSAVFLTATLGVATGAGPANAAATNAWRLVYRIPTLGQMTGITATGKANAWAVGIEFKALGQAVDQLLVVHWNGKTWNPVSVPGGNGFVAASVEASSARNVWVFAYDYNAQSRQAVFRYDGAHWHEMSVPAGVSSSGTGALGNPTPLVFSAADVWSQTFNSVCTNAGNLPPRCTTVLWHWNGHGWLKFVLAGNIHGVAGVSPDDVLAAGLGGQKTPGGPGTVVAYRWNGKRWSAVAVPLPRIFNYAQVGMDSASDVWIAAGTSNFSNASFALHWDGHRWTRTPVNPNTWSPVLPDGHGGVWLGNFAHWTGRSWINAMHFAAPLFFMGQATLAKIPGTAASYWGASAVTITGSQQFYPGISVYGPSP
jgi:hypothetical protein